MTENYKASDQTPQVDKKKREKTELSELFLASREWTKYEKNWEAQGELQITVT